MNASRESNLVSQDDTAERHGTPASYRGRMTTSTLLVVRVWQQPDRRGRAMFRASVRPVDAEGERLFTRATDLARYLRRVSRPGSSTASSEETA